MHWFIGSSKKKQSELDFLQEENDRHRSRSEEEEEEDGEDDDVDDIGPPPTAGPPLGPPPTTVSATSTPPRNVSDLTRPQRPIDPVFRSGVEYATFPKSQTYQHQPSHHQYSTAGAGPAVNVFVPSAPSQSQEEEGEEENEYANQGDDNSSEDENVDDENEEYHEEDSSSNENSEESDGDDLIEEEQDHEEENGNEYDEFDQEDEKFQVARQIYDGPTEEVAEPIHDGYSNHFHEDGVTNEEGGGGGACDNDDGVLDQAGNNYYEYYTDDGEYNDGDPNLIEEKQEYQQTSENEPATTSSSSYETPTRPTIKQSRFVFLSDQKSLPTDLKRFQERTIKRRRELLARMHDLDCQAARLTARVADEQMDLHLAIHDTFQRTVQRPLISSLERITIDKDSSSNPMILLSSERRVCDIDVEMTRHVHETLCDAKREQLESLHDGLQHGIVAELRMENEKYDRVEGGIVRRFEQVAGSIASDFHGECARRRGETELLQRKIEGIVPAEATERLEKKLLIIKYLREQLKKERSERQRSDQRIRAEISESKIRIERAMLAAFEAEL